MKKSEMVKKLTSLLKELENCQLREQEATEIIDFLQEHGMSPPVKKFCPVLLTTSHIWEREEE
jgi:hypothetical protein